jgi:hypothetical protein
MSTTCCSKSRFRGFSLSCLFRFRAHWWKMVLLDGGSTSSIFSAEQIWAYEINQTQVPHPEGDVLHGVVARPRYNAEGKCTFDGKVGIWPFVERVGVQRGSVNHPAGTWETKPVSVTAKRYWEFLIEKVLLAIKARWGTRCNNPTGQGIITHQAEWSCIPCHRNSQKLGKIKLLTQPAQSPDTHLLNLSFFRALQSSQWDHGFANEING